MLKYLNSFVSLIKSHLYISIFSGIVLLYIAIKFVFPSNSQPQFAIAQKGEITQEVSVTGRIKSSQDIKLSFEKSGILKSVLVKVGDSVTAGTALARLDQSEIYAQYQNALAGLEFQKTKLDELKKGARPEEIDLAQAKVQSSQTTLEDTKRSLINAFHDAYSKSDEAIHNKSDLLFDNARSASPTLKFTIADSQLKTEVEFLRFQLEPQLTDWQNFDQSISFETDLFTASSQINNKLNQIRNFLNKLGFVLASLTPNSSISQSTIDSYQSAVSLARINVSASVNTISSTLQAERTAESNLNLDKESLILKQAGATAEEISAQEAQIKQAQANVDSYGAQLYKTTLRAPINGTVTNIASDPGEFVSGNSPFISMVSEQNLEIEANIPETDIGKINKDNQVGITLDAFPDETFQGHVQFIDPAETIIDGAVNFKVKINFDKADPRFKSGLTANLSIEAIHKKDVLILPEFTIIEKDNGDFVKKIDGNSTTEIPVKIGIRGSASLVEIISGLNEGDKVLNVGIKQ